ncbi:MAG: helix-turn-helix transcriptional regulator [Deltaproteobacteria bacterium]|nr:helix-turn-helix transcriptional regulator [Deltaproteobacteria bacterium]
MSDFAKKLIELRNKSKLSLKEICEQAGIPPSRLVELENGVRIPTSGQIEHLENIYGVNSGGLAELSREIANTDW